MASSISLDPLSLLVEFPGGKSSAHQFSEVPNLPLVRQLMEAQLSMLNTGGTIKSVGTSANYATMIRWAPSTLSRLGFGETLEQLSPELFYAMMSELPGKNQELRLKQLLIRWDELHPACLHPDIVSHCYAQGTWTDPIRSTPVPPYSLDEAKRLEAACKLSISASEHRLARGRHYMQSLVLDKESLVSDRVLELIWREGPMGFREVAEKLDMGTSKINAALRADGLHWQRLLWLLYPSVQDLAPYLAMFELRSGINPDSSLALQADSIQPLEPGKVRIRWNKNRAFGLEADTFSTKGQWSPGRLVERARELTEPLRRHAADADPLWLVAMQHAKGTTQIARPLEKISLRHNLGLFSKAYGLLDDQGEPLVIDRRRLRKTFYARLDRQYHGAVNVIAGVNQSAQVAADHYLAQTQETPTIQLVVEQTQSSFVAAARSTGRPQVVASEKGGEEEISLLISELGLSADRAKTLLHTQEEDVFAAKCGDFYNSPHGKPGEACPSAVWECFSCPLAVITPSKLPNILALLDHIDRAYEGMSTSEWSLRYAQSRRNIVEHILPQFSDQVLEAARAQATLKGLYLPPEEMTT